MLRFAQNLSKQLLFTTTTTTTTTRLHALRHHTPPQLSTVRFFGSTNADPVALQMINYALGLARSEKTSESYAQALLVLEHGLSSANLRQGDTDTTKGTVLLAMSTLLSERGELSEAVDKLETIQDLGISSFGVKVAAIESLVGLNLEMGQDVASSTLADKWLELLKTNPEGCGCSSGEFEGFQARAKAAKGLVELVLGNSEKAGKCFEGYSEGKCFPGNAMLSHGEILHATGKFALAKEHYQKAIEGTSETNSFSNLHSLSACNMGPEEVLLGATCALGQLEGHSGNFVDAEEILSKALCRAEEHFGPFHPKVGVILTCIALMYKHKAKLESSSSLLVQEGLYRRAIDMLKAPLLDTEDEHSKVQGRDIVALARGGYAEILSVQQNRKGEGDRIRNCAEVTWTNRRLSLAEALEFSGPPKVAVVDTRISRVL